MTGVDRTVDVVVAGAGYAGLRAARGLVAAGLDVVVVEARDRVGGRVLTEVTGSGAVVDHGGQWIGPTQDRLRGLAAECGVATFPTHVDGANLEVRDGGIHPSPAWCRRRTRTGRPTPSPRSSTSTCWPRRSPPDPSVEHPDAARLDGTTLAEWVATVADTEVARSLVATAALAVFGCGPDELSLLYVLGYAHSGGSMSALIRTAGGAQEQRFAGGAQQMALRLADGLGDRMVLDAPVVGVAHDASGVTGDRRPTGTATGRVRRGGWPPGAWWWPCPPPSTGVSPSTRRCRAPRPAGPALAHGVGHQGPRRLRPPVLARRRAVRPGRGRHAGCCGPRSTTRPRTGPTGS